MRTILYILAALPILAADFTSTASFSVQSSPIASRICYTVPSGDAAVVGTWEVSESNTYSPLIPDINPALFTNAANDNRTGGSTGAGTQNRCFVVNALSNPATAYAPIDLTTGGFHRTSRALRPNTTYYGRITVGSDTATLTFATPNVYSGDSSPIFETATDPASGLPGWPTVDWNDTTKCYNDPRYGYCYQVWARPDQNASATPAVTFRSPSYQATGWTTPNNIFTDDGNFAVTSNTNPIVVVTDSTDFSDSGFFRLGGITFYTKGYVADACSVGNDRQAQVAMTIDGVNPYGPYIDVTLPTQTAYGAGVETAVGDAASYPVPFIKAWLYPGQPPPYSWNMMPRTGNYTRSGTTLSFTYSGSLNSFDAVNWVAGSHIVLDNAGTPTETTIATVTDAFTVTVASGSGPTTGAQFLASNFGFLIRKKTANCSMSITNVRAVKYNYRIPALNGGSGASRQTTDNRYHQGWYVSGASGSPVVLTVAGPDATTELGATEAIRIVNVVGCTSINGNHTIQARTATTVTLENGSTCNSAFSGAGSMWATAGKTGFIVQASNVPDAFANFFWIDPDTIPMEVHYLGQQFASSAAFSQTVLGSGNYNLDDSSTDFLSYWMPIIPTADPTKYHVYQGIYVGDATAGLFRDVGQGAGAVSQFRWVDKSNLTDQLVAFDATIDIPMAFSGMADATHLVMQGRYGTQQNDKGWAGIYDTSALNVTALGPTWRAPNFWLSEQHTGFAFTGQTGTYIAGHPFDGQDSVGPMFLTLTNSGANNTTPTDCATILAGLSLSNVLNITGNKCSSVTVSSLLMNNDASTENLGNAAVGMYFAFVSSSNVSSTEVTRIIGISGTTLVLQRNVWPGIIAAQPSGAKMQAFNTPNTSILSTGTYVNTGNYTVGSDAFWWDYINDPHMTNTNDPYGSQLSNGTTYLENEFCQVSHPSARGNVYIADAPACLNPPTCPAQMYGFRTESTRVGSFTSTAIQCVNTNPAFDGIPGSTASGQDADPHISSGCQVGPCANLVYQDFQTHQNSITWQQTIAKVGGRTYIYKVTNYCSYGGGVCDYKRQTIGLWIGFRAGVDVSAAGFDYASNDDAAHWYTFCRALKVNDCLSGSAIDDVYVNAPNVANRPAGYIDGTGYGALGYESRDFVHDQNDINVFMVPAHANEILQYPVSATTSDPSGRGSRRMGMPPSSPFVPITCAKCLGGSNNSVSVLSDGSAALLSNLLVVQPPYLGPDTVVDRTTWIPVTVASGGVPGSTSTAYVKFGYDSGYNCSSRREACVANAATIQSGNNVFKYLTSDAPTGLSCASGCNIVLPALSQRIMWYQWQFLDSMGMSTGTGPVTIIGTEPVGGGGNVGTGSISSGATRFSGPTR